MEMQRQWYIIKAKVAHSC